MARDIVEEVFDYVITSQAATEEFEKCLDLQRKDQPFEFLTEVLSDTTWINDKLTSTYASIWERQRKTKERFTKFTSADILACIKFEDVKNDVGHQNKRSRRVRFSTGQSISVESLIQCSSEIQIEKRQTNEEEDTLYRQCPDIDGFNYPPHAHIGEGENKIESVYLDDVKTVGYKSTGTALYPIYNNPFDPRLSFEGFPLIKDYKSNNDLGAEKCPPSHQENNREYWDKMFRDGCLDNDNYLLTFRSDPTKFIEDYLDSYRNYLKSIGNSESATVSALSDDDFSVTDVLSDLDAGIASSFVGDEDSEDCRRLFNRTNSESVKGIWLHNRHDQSRTPADDTLKQTSPASCSSMHKLLSDETMRKETESSPTHPFTYSDVVKLSDGSSQKSLAENDIQLFRSSNQPTAVGLDQISQQSIGCFSGSENSVKDPCNGEENHQNNDRRDLESPKNSIINSAGRWTPSDDSESNFSLDDTDLFKVGGFPSGRLEKAMSQDESSLSTNLGGPKHHKLNAATEPFVPANQDFSNCPHPPSSFNTQTNTTREFLTFPNPSQADWQRQSIWAPIQPDVFPTRKPSNQQQRQQLILQRPQLQQQQIQQQPICGTSMFWQQQQQQPLPPQQKQTVQRQPQPQQQTFLPSQFQIRLPQQQQLQQTTITPQQGFQRKPQFQQQLSQQVSQQLQTQGVPASRNNWISPFSLLEEIVLQHQPQVRNWFDGAANQQQSLGNAQNSSFRNTMTNHRGQQDLSKFPSRVFSGGTGLNVNQAQFISQRNAPLDGQLDNFINRRAPEQPQFPAQPYFSENMMAARIAIPNNNAVANAPQVPQFVQNDRVQPFIHIRPRFNTNFNSNNENDNNNNNCVNNKDNNISRDNSITSCHTSNAVNVDSDWVRKQNEMTELVQGTDQYSPVARAPSEPGDGQQKSGFKISVLEGLRVGDRDRQTRKQTKKARAIRATTLIKVI